jgi:hypothetical protein
LDCQPRAFSPVRDLPIAIDYLTISLVWLTINQVWSMDFVQDALYNGSRFRILTVVDNYTKKCLSLLVGQSLKGSDVRDELSNIAIMEGT